MAVLFSFPDHFGSAIWFISHGVKTHRLPVTIFFGSVRLGLIRMDVWFVMQELVS